MKTKIFILQISLVSLLLGTLISFSVEESAPSFSMLRSIASIEKADMNSARCDQENQNKLLNYAEALVAPISLPIRYLTSDKVKDKILNHQIWETASLNYQNGLFSEMQQYSVIPEPISRYNRSEPTGEVYDFMFLPEINNPSLNPKHSANVINSHTYEFPH